MTEYFDEDAFLKDYRKLTEEYRGKDDRYQRKLLQIQRAEQKVTAEVRSVEWKKRGDVREGIKCSFCGKHQDDCEFIIAGPKVYICGECARICQKILDEREAELEGEKTNEAPKQ